MGSASMGRVMCATTQFMRKSSRFSALLTMPPPAAITCPPASATRRSASVSRRRNPASPSVSKMRGMGMPAARSIS